MRDNTLQAMINSKIFPFRHIDTTDTTVKCEICNGELLSSDVYAIVNQGNEVDGYVCHECYVLLHESQEIPFVITNDPYIIN